MDRELTTYRFSFVFYDMLHVAQREGIPIVARGYLRGATESHDLETWSSIEPHRVLAGQT